jgi:putative transposase
LRRAGPAVSILPSESGLFAAKNVGSGKVVYVFNKVHTNQEWIQFLTLIEKHSPPDKQIHLIIDNYSAHKHPNVQRWLAERPRFHIHYAPTSGSWLNQVERLFGEVNRKCLKHRSFPTVEALQQDLAQFLNRRNENPKPINWKATTDEILEACVAIFARPLRRQEAFRCPTSQHRTLF